MDPKRLLGGRVEEGRLGIEAVPPIVEAVGYFMEDSFSKYRPAMKQTLPHPRNPIRCECRN